MGQRHPACNPPQATEVLKAFTSRPVTPKRMLTPAPNPMRTSRLLPRLQACDAAGPGRAVRARPISKRAARANLPQQQPHAQRPAHPTASHPPTLPEAQVF